MIDREIASSLVNTIASRIGPARGGSVAYEIQDAGEFVLFSLDITGAEGAWPRDAQSNLLRVAAGDLERALPARIGNYRWMIVVRQSGKVINSAMGGWSGMPTA